MTLSVVIPTYHRKAILGRCLQALAEQTTPPECFEVIVVDDGSTDGTTTALAEWAREVPYRLRPLAQSNQGPAAARNRGLAAAQGEWTLFLGDDILATPELIAQHLAWHVEEPGEEMAVLGRITWDRSLRITPLMRWLEESGAQFAYPRMRHGEAVPEGSLYSSNVSFGTRFLQRHGGFDERFRRAAWEDSELQYRLEALGLRTRYNAEAVAYHHHPTGLGDFVRRSFVTGYEFGRARALHPDRIRAAPPFSPLKARALRLKAPFVTVLAALANRGLVRPHTPFWWLLDYHFWRGVRAWERASSAECGIGEAETRRR